MSELVKWPDIHDYQTVVRVRPDIGPIYTSNSAQIEAYERARAEAAISRLRVAVEALKDAQDVFDRNTNSQRSPFSAQVYAIQKALHTIGDIPESL